MRASHVRLQSLPSQVINTVFGDAPTVQLHELLGTFSGRTDDNIATATETAERLGGTVTEHPRGDLAPA